MFGTLGLPELLVIFAIILVVFGAGKLPQLGKGQNEVTQGENREKAGLTESSIEQLTLKRFHVALEQIYRRAKATEGVVRLRQR